MMNGGYKIIDITGATFAESGGSISATVAGIFDRIEENTVPVIISGFYYNNVEYPDAYVVPLVSGSNFVFDQFGYHFIIDDDDKVTISANPTITNATTTTAGIVKKASKVTDGSASTEGTNPTVAEFNALVTQFNDLLAKLKTAGIMSTT